MLLIRWQDKQSAGYVDVLLPRTFIDGAVVEHITLAADGTAMNGVSRANVRVLADGSVELDYGGRHTVHNTKVHSFIGVMRLFGSLVWWNDKLAGTAHYV
jgi:hypothetical protein